MNDFSRTYSGAPSMDMSTDAGLRSFMLGVYNKMGLGLVLSAILAFVTSSVPAVTEMLFTTAPVMLENGRIITSVQYTLLGSVVAFAPLVILLGSMFMMRNPSKTGANLLYWTIVTLIGASLGVWGLKYTDSSIAQAFVVTAAAFGGVSLYGYTTKKDLSGWGSFLIMGVIGLIVASILNMFLGSGLLMMGISVLGTLIFAGLTAYDTQRLKVTYYQLGGDETAMSVATSYGALSLYINFINLFQFILSLMSRD